MEALADQQPGITLLLRDYRDGDLADAWYAIAATDDPAVNAAVVAESRAAPHLLRARRRRTRRDRRDAGLLRLRRLLVGVLASGEHRRSAAVRTAIREAFQQGASSPTSWPARPPTWCRAAWRWSVGGRGP